MPADGASTAITEVMPSLHSGSAIEHLRSLGIDVSNKPVVHSKIPMTEDVKQVVRDTFNLGTHPDSVISFDKTADWQFDWQKTRK